MASNLVVVVVFIQTATRLQFDATASLKDVAWLTEAAANAGTCTVGGGFRTAGNTSWTTLSVHRIRGTCCGHKIRQKKREERKRKRKKIRKEIIEQLHERLLS